MVDTGELDYRNVSTGYLLTIAPMYFPPSHSVYLAASIKEVVDLPVCCIGRMIEPTGDSKRRLDNDLNELASPAKVEIFVG